MFKVGDLIVYSTHGVCSIDDICEKTFSGITKSYYILHPISDEKLTISIPIDSEKVIMLELLSNAEAEEILECFKEAGIGWIELDNQRSEVYSNIVRNGNRKEIAKVANTLMKKKIDAERKGKKFHEKDRRLLTNIQNILFSELACSLNTTYEVIKEKINTSIK